MKREPMKKLLALTLLALLAACNTMEGLGQDFQSAGTALENSANKSNPQNQQQQQQQQPR